MAEHHDRFSEHCRGAIRTAAEELGLDPLALAKSLDPGEIARLVHLLNAAMRYVDHAGLRHRIEDTLMAVTDGRMPSDAPESELDWAMKIVARRRVRDEGGDEGGEEEA